MCVCVSVFTCTHIHSILLMHQIKTKKKIFWFRYPSTTTNHSTQPTISTHLLSHWKWVYPLFSFVLSLFFFFASSIKTTYTYYSRDLIVHSNQKLSIDYVSNYVFLNFRPHIWRTFSIYILISNIYTNMNNTLWNYNNVTLDGYST